MPTNNPKISLYLPDQIHDRLKKFKEERNLSMSQAGIVILAEYFGIKEFTKKTATGGVTLAEFEELKERLIALEKKVNLQNATSSLPSKRTSTNPAVYQTELIKEEAIGKLFLDRNLLAKRLGTSPGTISNKRSYFQKKDKASAEVTFREWTKQLDPNWIGWGAVKDGRVLKYTPIDMPDENARNNLFVWFEKNYSI